MFSHLTQRMSPAFRLLVIAALLTGLALGLRLVPVAQAAVSLAVSQLPEPTYLTLLPEQATNLLPTETSHQFTAAVRSQYGASMPGVVVSFSTDFGLFGVGVQYVEVQTDVLGVATVTITSTTVGTAHIRAWIDGISDDTYSTGEVTDDLSTKTWQEEGQPDFGDAPDSYGTLLASNGALHIIVSGLHLGLTVDGEADGQPSANADGDDLDSNDDEDGVALQPILVRGTTAAVVVHAGPSGGLLDAWIDFNGNNVFDHPGEHLFAGTSQALTPGANPPLSFQVPSGASTGSTYARFRLSTNGGLPPTGPVPNCVVSAPDGEVEDYPVEIQVLPEGTGTVVLEKKTDPPGGSGFNFINDFGVVIPEFNLDDGMTLTIPNVPAGTYSVTEADPIPFGFDLTGLTCEDPDDGSSVDLATRTATIDLDAGETITCTFNNAERGTVVLQKQSDPAGGSGFDFINDFGIGIPGFSLDDGMTLTIPYVPSGTYSVTEADPVPPFDLIGLTCEDPDDGSSVDLATRTATIDLDAGETITCTFINGQSGSIIVEKQTDPDGAAGSFTFSGDAAGTISDNGQIVVGDLSPGTYTATEANPGPDFDLTAITCDDDNSTGDVGTRTATFNLEAGETVKCTFTNIKQGTISIVKDAAPDDLQDFDFSGDLGNFFLDDDTDPTLPNTATFQNQAPGTYSVSEVSIPAGWNPSSIVCNDPDGGTTTDLGTATANIDLDAGEGIVCTFTNIKQGTISIVKDAAPDDPQDFDFSGDLGGFSLDDDTDPTLANTATFQNQAPGTYSVSEVSIPAGWNLSSIVCNDPDGGTTTDLGTATANIDLDAGEGIVCTFTNIKQGTISIVKDAAPDDPQDFDFSGDLGGFSLDDDTDPTLANTATFQNQAPGTYSVSEVSIPTGWNLSSIVCNDPDGGTTTDLGTATANIDLDAGEGIVCTFTNTKHGTIVVEKQTDPDGAAGSFTFSGDAAGTISDGGQIVVTDLLPGTYTATEADPGPDFDLTAITCNDGNSSGDVGTRTATFNLEAGETVKCTFTNAQQHGTIIVEKQTDPDGAAGSFTFSGDAAGTISDGGQIVVADLQPGTYTATEADPGPDFELTAITCDDDNSSGDVGARTATFVLDPDEIVKCTFTNARRSLQVSKELELPVGGLAAVDQIVRFLITVENDGGLTIDPLTLRDDYDSWCLRSRRAEVPPDVHGGSLGFLQWNDLGALAPGESMSLWVEFTAAHGCEKATNRATVETGGLTFEDEATVRILETIARVGGFIFHDDNGNGALDLPCQGTDVDPATCEPGLEHATAETTLPSGELYQCDTNTSGWYSFNLLDPGTYHVEAAAPADSWWTPTTAEECDATVVNNWDQVFCHFGYWWGLDGPPMQSAGVAGNQVTLVPTQDVTISEWNGANEGHNEHLRVRQPGVTSALLQFDLSGLPAGAEIVWAKLRLYSPFASNSTNRLYMTAYPLETMWTEDGATWLQAATGVPWDAAGATGDHGDPVGWAWMDAPGWVEFDLDSDLLAGWLADPVSNHGLLLRGEGSGNREVAYWFFSREYLNADVQPQLVVGYDLP